MTKEKATFIEGYINKELNKTNGYDKNKLRKLERDIYYKFGVKVDFRTPEPPKMDIKVVKTDDEFKQEMNKDL